MHRKLLTVVLCFFTSINNVSAAGFTVKETSALHVGQAFAGMAAVKDSIAALWNNPAVMTNFNNHSIETSASCIIPVVKFIPHSSHTARGDKPATTNPFAIAPAMYSMYSLNDRFKLGLAVTVPFGASTNYDKDSVLREIVVKSKIESININPNIAYKVNSVFSVGLGLSLQQLKLQLSKYHYMPSGANKKIKISGHGWHHGYNLGVQIKPIDCVIIGLSYRSKVKHSLKGQIDHESAPSHIAKTKITTPASIDISINYQIHDKLSLLSSLVWSEWSCFDKIDIDALLGILAETHEYNWKNVYCWAFGVNYQFKPDTMLRAGIAHDQSPVGNIKNPAIPDSDRFWLAVGVDYSITNNIRLGINYAHITIKNFHINYNVPIQGSSKKISGKMQGKADVIGLQFIYKF